MSDENASLKWVPLESNPELFTEWARNMGLDTSRHAYHDVWGMDDELLAMVPQPVQAVLLLFPINEAYERKRVQEDENVLEGGELEGEMWFKQTIGNACGTIGLLHSLANSSARQAVAPDSPLAKLLEQAAPLSPVERAQLLSTSRELAKVHSNTASEGQTQAPSADASVDLHFVAFVRASDGQLTELDGRRKGPLRRGVQVEKQEDLLKVTANWVKDNYMTLTDSLNFNLIALGPAAEA